MTTKRPNPIPGNKPFPKGVSGNPKGRPKLPDLREALAACLANEQNGQTALEAALAAMRAKAVRGDVRALELLLNRAFGMAQQNLDVTSGGQQITPPIVWSDAAGS